VQLRVVTDQPWVVPADLLVVPIVGEPAWDGPLGEIDRRANGELQALHAFGELRAKRFTSSLAASGAVKASRILTISAGDPVDLDRETVVHVGAAAAHRLSGRVTRSMAVWLEPLTTLEGGAEAVAMLVARGVVEGGYDPATIYREHVKTAPPVLDELILIAPAGADVAGLTAAAVRGQVIGEGANLARTLANRSSNDVSPEVLAEEAWGLAEKHGLWIDVIGPEKATELGMGMFMAVGQGSDNPPRMIVMRSGKKAEKDAAGRHLAIIGKGVCFDSGGISIKPADRMEEMKMDKTGACTVIAAIATVARLAPGTPLLALAPAVENMPGPHSTRPGDIVKALNGKWVDIINTDAEGRLILGDAMTYAEQLGATHLVDVATLTGAVARALGDMVTGAFGNDQAWTDSVLEAGASAGERYWQLPLVDDYLQDMESWYGDSSRAVSSSGSSRRSPGSTSTSPGPATTARPSRSRPAAPRAPRMPPSSSSRSPGRSRPDHAATGRMSPLVLGAAVVGAVWGIVADRIGARWPAHEDGSIRAVDWRTAAVVAMGAIAPALLALRYGDDARAFVVLGVLVVALILLFATDLDQRLLPDVITFPIAAYALLGFVTGIGPIVRSPGDLLVAAVAAVGIPLILFAMSIPFGAGAIGIGDLKLLFGVGLLVGAQRLVATVIVGAVAAAVGILVLLALRRISLKSYVPYGPFLIIGAVWAVTVSRGL